MLRELKIVFTTALGLSIMPDPAFATTKEQAYKMCSARGAQCVSHGIGGQNDPGGDVILCVDNRSSGQGIQCVRCKGSSACTVLYQHPDGKPIIPGKSVRGVLTNSPAQTTQTTGTTGSKVLGSGNLLGGGSGPSSQGPSATGSPAPGAAPAAPAGRLY